MKKQSQFVEFSYGSRGRQRMLLAADCTGPSNPMVNPRQVENGKRVL